MAPGRTRLIEQALAWGATAVVLLLIALFAVPGTRDPHLIDLSGTWPATVVAPAPPEHTELRIPGHFAAQGLDPNAKVQVRIPVEVPEATGPWGLWLDRPKYAVRVWWDGELVESVGFEDAPFVKRRSDRPIFVPLVASTPGTHELLLELQGDFGDGGLVGRALVGPLPSVRTVHARTEGERVGLALALSLLGVVHLAVAGLRRRRLAHLLYGLFAASLAFWASMHTELMAVMIDDVVVRSRLRKLVLGVLPALGVSFLAAHLHNRLTPREAWLLAFGALLGLLGLMVPANALYTLELVQDVFHLVCGGLALWVVGAALRARVPGSALLGLAFVPLLLGVIDQITVFHGLRAAESSLFLAVLGFLAVSSAALAVRHAREAERHERLVQGSVDAMVGVDPDGEVTVINPAAAALLPAPQVGNTLLKWVAPDDHPLVRAHLARAAECPDRAEFRLEARGKELVVESLATPLDDRSSLLVLRDVTRRRQLDQGILQAARMETVGVLVGGIAHDFNNMLGTLLAHVGFLQATLDDDGAQGRLERMESTIERASLLTRRLLTVAGGTHSDLGSIDIEPVCRGAAELVEPTLPPGVTLSIELDDDLAPVLGAAADLEHVVVNLLVNARDAVGVAGHLRLVARNFLTRSGARGVVVAVEDDGPGVPPELRERIFTPFFTTKGPNRGTGLGLAVASQILRDHHGRIWVEERPGGGSRFCVGLRHADAMDRAPAPLPEGRRVLLVEDESALLDAYASALREAGYEVTAFDNGSTAWRWLHQNRPDILVSDVVMPGMSGLEIATLCRELHPEIPVLLVSGFIPQSTIDTLAPGTWHRLDKPVRSARLVSTVGRICRRAERAAAGELDITEVTYLFPPLDELSGEALGL